MSDRERLAQVLDEALAAIAAGADPAAMLAQHPDLAAELGPMLAAAQAAGAGRSLAAVPRPAQSASRAEFLAQAGRLRAGAAPLPAKRRPGLRLGLARGWLALLIVTAGLAGLSYGAVTASAESLPGDALYPVKRAAEDVQLRLALGTQSQERLEAAFDERRAREVQALADQGRLVRVDFTGWLVDLSTGSGHWLVAGIPIELAPGALVEGSLAAGERVQVMGTVQPDRSVLAERVRVLLAPRATATAEPSATTTATPQPTASASATARPQASATKPAPSPAPSATDDPYELGPSQTPSPTGGHGGPSPSNTPQPTDDHGGPSASNTPQPTSNNGGPSASNTPEPTSDNGGPSASNTPKPTDEDDDHSGPSPSNTPKPGDGSGGGPGHG